MDFQGVRPDLIKFEMRQTTGNPAWEKDVKKPGFFGRLLSGTGRIIGGVATPLSFVFPPAALAAAGMYGMAATGDIMQASTYSKIMEAQAARSMTQASFPGLAPDGIAIQPASGTPMSPYNEMVMGVLFSRDQATNAMSHNF